MPDQADELRKLVAEKGPASEPLITTERGFPEFTAAGREWAMSKPKPEDWLPAELLGGFKPDPVLMALAASYAHPTPDKAKLWDELKAELEHEATHHDYRKNKEWGQDYGKLTRTEESLQAQSFLDRMNRAEVLATYVRPATDATFARVAESLKTGGGSTPPERVTNADVATEVNYRGELVFLWDIQGDKSIVSSADLGRVWVNTSELWRHG